MIPAVAAKVINSELLNTAEKEGVDMANAPQSNVICNEDDTQKYLGEEEACKLMQATGGNEVTTSGSEIMELEEVEGSCLSFDSDLNRSSFNSRSIIKPDGHLDHEKMLSWALPTINTLNLRRLASESFPTLARTYGGAGGKKTPSILAHSTPVTHVTNRKMKKAKKKLETSSAAEEKRNLIIMLNKFKNSDPSEK